MARAASFGAVTESEGGFSFLPLAWILLFAGFIGAIGFVLVKGHAQDARPLIQLALTPDEFKPPAEPPAPAVPLSPEAAFTGEPPLPRTSMPAFPDAAPSADAPAADSPAAAGDAPAPDAAAPQTDDPAPAIPAPAPGPNALAPVPDPALVFYGRHGPLPVVAPDGRKPRDIYARPFDKTDTHPRIALVVGGLGLSRSMTEMAIKSLPPAVTLSFTPYAKDLQLLINSARAAGHEVMLELPMEPFDYPHNDPGPYTLLTQADQDENLDKLDWIMSRFTGYAGVISDQGDKMLGSMEDLRPILSTLNERGLYFVDPGQAKRSMAGRLSHELGMAWTLSAGPIDQPASRNGIELKLLQLEEAARGKGNALGTGFAYPTTIDQIRTWTDTLAAKGLVLAPVSAVVTTPQREPTG